MGLRWTIYSHTHIDSQRRYIGLTKLTIMKRWNQHLINARSKRGKGCAHFWNAIRKYGKNAFSHEILEICNTLESANVAEIKWIDFYDTFNPEKGFNLVKGGNYVPAPIKYEIKNPWNNPEFRIKHRAIMKEVMESPEFSTACSIANKEVWSRPGYREKMKKVYEDIFSRPEVLEKLRKASLSKPCSQAIRIAISKTTSIQKRKVDGYVSCGKHGLVPFTECYETRSETTGHILYRCKQCIINRTKARYRKTHPKCRNFVKQ
jgi:hypothetical protein